jgi:hypothetical protein
MQQGIPPAGRCESVSPSTKYRVDQNPDDPPRPDPQPIYPGPLPEVKEAKDLPEPRIITPSAPGKEQMPLILTSQPAAAPPPPESPLVTTLRLLQEKRYEEAAKHLRNLDSGQAEAVATLLQLAIQMNEAPQDQVQAKKQNAFLLEQLNQLSLEWRMRAPLKLEKVCFCRKIVSFGDYDPLPAELSPVGTRDGACYHVFQAGSQGRPGEKVQVYVEVRNFASQKRGEVFVTGLSCKLEIVHDGAAVAGIAPMVFPTHLDRSYTPRQDYFINFAFHIPPRLPPGDYKLLVEISDELGPQINGKPRTAHHALDFRVAGNGV